MSNFYNIWVLLKIMGHKSLYYVNTFLNGNNNDVSRYDEESVSLFNHLNYLCTDPTFIIDNIYLGSSYNSNNIYTIQKFGIEKIINVTQEIPSLFPEIEYLRIPIRDTRDSFIENYLENSYQFITKNNKHQILIHCYMGASRSATVVIYYLMKHHKMSLEQALEYLQKKRPIININVNFVKELKDIENRINMT